MIKILSYYSGETGFYSVAYPTQDSVRNLHDFLTGEVGVDAERLDAPSTWHVTIMTSPDFAPKKRDIPVLDRNAMFPASVKKFNYWGGHDNKGYIVAELESPALLKQHEFWKGLGCKHTFDPFTPHVTLLTKGNAAPITAKLCNLMLRRRSAPIHMEFGAHNFEDFND
jgi:2'-5' RNA ligase